MYKGVNDIIPWKWDPWNVSSSFYFGAEKKFRGKSHQGYVFTCGRSLRACVTWHLGRKSSRRRNKTEAFYSSIEFRKFGSGSKSWSNSPKSKLMSTNECGSSDVIAWSNTTSSFWDSSVVQQVQYLKVTQISKWQSQLQKERDLLTIEAQHNCECTEHHTLKSCKLLRQKITIIFKDYI